MRRTLLVATCCLSLAGTQTFAADGLKWQRTVEKTVSKWGEINFQAPVAVDNAGNTYATGTFNGTIVIGSTVLDPIGGSSYLAKYDADGNVAWAVGLRGAATITAMTTDEQNNVYVAGTLADAVEVGSTDGKAQTIKGKPGEVEYQVSGFIAAYSAEGALKATKVVWSETDTDVANSTDGFYLPDTGFPRISINHIEVAGNKLYASATYTGDVSVDNMKWEGAYVFSDEMPIYFDAVSGGVLSLDAATLGSTESVACVSTTGSISSNKSGVESISFTTEDDNTVYLCFAAQGTLTLTCPDGSEDISLELGTGGMCEHAFVTAAIRDGKTTTKIFHAAPHDNGASFNEIGKMQIEGDTLYIGGTFHQTMPFAGELTHTGACDLFAAALDKNSLEAQWTANSGLDEGDGDAQHFYENFTSMTVTGGKVSLYGYVLKDQDNKKTITKPLAYTCLNGTATADDFPLLVTGAATNGRVKAFLSADTTDCSATVSVYTIGGDDGIIGVKALSARHVGNTFYFAEANDIAVYDLQGRMLKQASHATSVCIDDLKRGIYVISNGKDKLKALKTSF